MRAPTNKIILSLGRTVATPAALKSLELSGQTHAELLHRHERGDWGEVDEEGWAVNDEALKDGLRVLSIYTLKNSETVWIITEADRSATTILLPSEY